MQSRTPAHGPRRLSWVHGIRSIRPSTYGTDDRRLQQLLERAIGGGRNHACGVVGIIRSIQETIGLSAARTSENITRINTIMAEFDYGRFISRNAGYVSAEVQHRIRNSRLLVAGCGIGSTIAEACLRLGFEHLVLIDKDQVEPHNLNRQDFTASDIGTQKVDALTRRLLSINPSASIRAVNDWVTPQNAAGLVNEADIILDTIDFLSLEGIVALHDAGHAQKKPPLPHYPPGGAAVIYFPPDGNIHFELFSACRPQVRSGTFHTLISFMRVIGRLEADLSEDVVAALKKTLTVMDDGHPCPAPHVSAGSWAIGSLAATIAVRVLRGEPIDACAAHDIPEYVQSLPAAGVDLL